MAFIVLGQGTALPKYSIGQAESVGNAVLVSCRNDEERRVLPMLYRMSGVKRRYSVLLEGPEGDERRQRFFTEPTNDEDRGPRIGARMEKYEEHSRWLAERAAGQALERSEVLPDDITHLVTVSCSGFAAPGVDVGLIKALGLKRTVERVHVGFMGCHGALNGLRVARGLGHEHPNARILVCAVELCSLHYHFSFDPEQIVANALFADGAAAVVVGSAQQSEPNAWELAGTGSCLVPDSEDAMTWRIRDHGFVMSLSPRVPDLICSFLKDFMHDWLGGHGLTLDNVATWAVHPGGPRILSAVVDALGLEKTALAVSREVLRDHGNMSSPTILFILDRLRSVNAPRPCVALGFGPGLMAEAALFV